MHSKFENNVSRDFTSAVRTFVVVWGSGVLLQLQLLIGLCYGCTSWTTVARYLYLGM